MGSSKTTSIDGGAIAAGDWLIISAYGAFLSVTMLVAMRAQSPQILETARVLCAAWATALLWYFAVGKNGLSWGYAVIDLALAVYFWRAGLSRWFPRPLFAITALRIVLHAVAAAAFLPPGWVVAVGNRLSDFVLIYVLVCGIYRLRQRGAPL